MRVLGIAPSSVFSGFEKSFFDAIAKQGAKVDVFENEIPWLRYLCTMSSISWPLKKWALRRDLHYHTSILAFEYKSRYASNRLKMINNSYDIIYQIGGLWNPLKYSNSLLPLVLQVDYTSILSQRRGSEWKRKSGRCQNYWIEQETELFQVAKTILTTTDNARRSIIDDYKIDPSKIITVGGGVSPPYDIMDHNRVPKYSSQKILFVGKGFYGKGLDTLLEAFQILHVTCPDSQLTIVGPTDAIEGPGINYLGRIANRDHVREIFYEHAVFVMPSRFEPLGQVFLEAMSCKLPCIGTLLDAMPELIEDRISGYIIEPGNAEQLADRLRTLILDATLSETMGRAGFSKICNMYNWDIVGKKIYANLLQSIEK